MGHPDTAASLSLSVLGPRLPGGIRPRATWSRTAPRPRATRSSPPKTARALKRWLDARRAREAWSAGAEAGPLGGDVAWRRGAVRRWSVRLGRASTAAGRFDLRRSIGTTATSGNVRLGWRRSRGRGTRLELDARLAPRDGTLRVRSADRGGGWDLRLRSTRARRSTRATATRRARAGRPSEGRATLRLREGRWRLGAAVAVRGDSVGLEGSVARSFALRPGSLEASMGLKLGPVREARLHAGFRPKARLGPLGFRAGAGAVLRRRAARVTFRPELSAGLELRLKRSTARIGWEVSPSGLRLDGSPALAGRLEARPGPFRVSAMLRPSTTGLRWSAALEWTR
ncbi:MAG: hypothetical protein HZB25_14110 [Candidatus Eisenbacteria bacterium]|nr:hypothetical protein [Candidatus Eisenbacteria bacterium]